MTFVTDERHVLHALGDLLDGLRHELDSADGLRASHHRVLAHVPADGTSVTELAAAVGMTKQGIGQFVAQLSESGHLRTETDPSDRRAKVVRRTAKGAASVRRLTRRLDRLEEDWAARVGERRYATFRRVLDELSRPPA